MAEIWNTKLKKEGIEEQPAVIPLLIYHGENSWNMETTLGGMISGYKNLPAAIRQFVPDYTYLLYDVTEYTDEEIKGKAQIKILFTAFRDVWKAKNVEETMEVIDKAVKYLRELDDQQTGIEYFETFMRYVFSAARNLKPEDVNEIIYKVETTYSEGSELVMTLADILRQEGEEKGKKEGKEEGVKEVAREMLKKGASIGFIAEVTHLDVKEIEKLKEA